MPGTPQFEARVARQRALRAANRARNPAAPHVGTPGRLDAYGNAVKRGGQDRLFSRAEVENALTYAGGLIGIAAKRLKVSRTTVARYLARYPSLKRHQLQCKELTTDEAEWALITAAKKGAPWAVQWYLKYQARDRGYREEPVAHADQKVTVEVTYSDDALRPMAARLTEERGAPSAQALPPPDVVEAEVDVLEAAADGES